MRQQAKIMVGEFRRVGYITALDPDGRKDEKSPVNKNRQCLPTRASTGHQSVVGKRAIVVRCDNQVVEHGNFQQLSALH